MSVHVHVEAFEGPLDLLLQLVERNELDLSIISLAQVADQFVTHLHAHPEIPLEEVADFLVVAAKLMYLKSKLLFPEMQAAELEEGPTLEEQLRRYREFVEASREIQRRWDLGARAFSRAERPQRLRETMFLPPPMTAPEMRDLMVSVIARLIPPKKMRDQAIERIVSIQERMSHVWQNIQQLTKTTFRTFVGSGASKAEMVVTFLAILELMKQRFVRVKQTKSFEDLAIEAHPEAGDRDPFAHSFV